MFRLSASQLRVGQVLLALLLVVSYWWPWVQLEIVPVEGWYLPELAREKYGHAHWLYYLSFAFWLLPLWGLAILWNNLLGRPLRLRWVHWPVMVILLSGMLFLGYQVLFSALNLSLREGFWVAHVAGWALVMLELTPKSQK